jgi:hypothetical protein
MITKAEAAAALAAEGTGPEFFITDAEPEVSMGVTVYMVGRHAEDPEESDLDGDPTGFDYAADGTVICVGPIF